MENTFSAHFQRARCEPYKIILTLQFKCSYFPSELMKLSLHRQCISSRFVHDEVEPELPRPVKRIANMEVVAHSCLMLYGPLSSQAHLVVTVALLHS